MRLGDAAFPALLVLSGLFGIAALAFTAALGLAEWKSMLVAGIAGALLLIEGLGLIYRARWARRLSPYGALLAAILPPIGTATLIYGAFWHRRQS